VLKNIRRAAVGAIFGLRVPTRADRQNASAPCGGNGNAIVLNHVLVKTRRVQRHLFAINPLHARVYRKPGLSSSRFRRRSAEMRSEFRNRACGVPLSVLRPDARAGVTQRRFPGRIHPAGNGRRAHGRGRLVRDWANLKTPAITHKQNKDAAAMRELLAAWRQR
jgi:hypothetical protein